MQAHRGAAPRWKSGAIAIAGFAAAFVIGWIIVSGPEKSEKNTAFAKAEQSAPAVTPRASSAAPPAEQRAQRTNCKVSLAHYQSLSTGMSYARVVAILGCPGSELSRTDMAGFTTVMYMWEGSTLASNMNIMFQNDGLVSKAQFGLR